jgi:uncharacterized Zn-binding protein involved in type VI secretion
MPKVCRIGDVHACGAVATGGSPTTYANSSPVHRIGDIDTHCGTTTQKDGSPTVFADNIPVARIGDDHKGDPCPHPPNPQVTGSPNVYADEG